MIGRTVSHYRIEAKLGEGGMGEVYLAEDSSLGRKVALKFLPEAWRDDPVARKRFLREARSAAALDHPFICDVIEIAQTEEGRDFIAMEYLEGETLRARLARGPLPLREALRLGAELAEALESAHAKGIAHRDLKPANIMIGPTGHAKVMDFGLAKKIVAEDGREQDISSALTREGATLGTLSYMSPEQLRGGAVDHRSDIFSLGIVLYEMAAGVHPFRKARPAETTSALLKDDPPPLGRYVDEAPELLAHTVGKMLAKDPAERYQSVHEVLTNLNRLREDSGRVRTAEARRTAAIPVWAWIAVTAVLAFALGAMAIRHFLPQSDAGGAPPPVMRFSIHLPDGERLASGSTQRHAVAVSPDGRWVAYASYRPGEGDAPDGAPAIHLRRLDRTEVRRVPGFNPFFSPDGGQLGFVERDGEGRTWLKRTAVESVRVETVTELRDPRGAGGYGCAWLPDGTIAFAPEENGGLLVVPAVGGEPRPLTEPDAKGEVGHRLPSALPGTRAILYTAVRYVDYPDWSVARIVALRLDTGERRVLVEGGSDGRYAASGHLLFAREGRLLAARFDPGRLEVRGEPAPVWDGVVHSVHTGHVQSETGAAHYGVSRDGLAAFSPGSVAPEARREVVRVDREGREEPLGAERRHWLSARLSPDGRRALLTTNYPPRAVWLYDFERGILRRQTFEGRALFAVWGAGPEEFTWGADPEGPMGVYVKALDSGAGPGEKLATEWEGPQVPSSRSPDGRRLAFVVYSADLSHDIWIFDRETGAAPFLRTRFFERYPEFSPDGRRLAYASNESGRIEVYVRPFPGPGRPTQISTNGGRAPCWSRDGREIFYTLWDPASATREYYAVPLEADGDHLRPGVPKRLLGGRYSGSSPVRDYDVGPDGVFLLIKADPDRRTRIREAQAPVRIELVLNWFEDLRARVPVD
jgi:eukaryotic-like serine/threonine-protein kinase